MATPITVLRGGGRYDANWVERLACGVRRRAPAFDRILCLTDLPLAPPGVERVSLRHGRPAWWAKTEAFRPGPTEGTTLLCDLDTVVTGPADAPATPGFAAMEDYVHRGRLSSALSRWLGEARAGLYTTFAAESPSAGWRPAPAARSRMRCTAIRSSSIERIDEVRHPIRARDHDRRGLVRGDVPLPSPKQPMSIVSPNGRRPTAPSPDQGGR